MPGQPYAPPSSKWITALQEPQQQAAVALWAFLHPGALPAAEGWVKARCRQYRQHGFSSKARVLLSLRQLLQLQGHLAAELGGAGGQWLVLLWQAPGDKVHVPPGWLHQVGAAAGAHAGADQGRTAAVLYLPESNPAMHPTPASGAS